MSVLYPNDCLAHHMDRPLFRKMNVGEVPCSVYAHQMARFAEDGLDTMPYPETDALQFYQLNHALAMIQQKFHPLEPLPAEYLDLVNEFFDVTSIAARRAMLYLIVICTRETRHLQQKEIYKPLLEQQFGKKVSDYVCSLPDSAKTAMAKFKTSPPDAFMGPYVEALWSSFFYGKWHSGYGGKAWATVTDCLRSFVKGQYSLVMLMDTVWTLCHNNGPIFNKGDFYKMYQSSYLKKILDVQRAGMIPTFIETCEDGEFQNAMTPQIKHTNKKIMELFDLPRTIDWQEVNKLGSVQHYNDDGSIGYKGKAAKPKKPPEDVYEIYPGFAVPIIKLKRAA